MKLVTSPDQGRTPSSEVDSGWELDDGWALELEEALPNPPSLQVVGTDAQAVPVQKIYDDGWAIAAEAGAPGEPAQRLRLSTNTEEEAFFTAGDELAASNEPLDSFDDLAEDRGSFWQRLLAWWRGGAAAGRRRR